MEARYEGICGRCESAIGVGDEIARDKKIGFAAYSHTRCIPVAGEVERAGFEVRWREDGVEGVRRYVRRGSADSHARYLQRAADRGWKGSDIRVVPL